MTFRSLRSSSLATWLAAAALILAACDSGTSGGATDTASGGTTDTAPTADTGALADTAATTDGTGGHPSDVTSPGADILDPKCVVPSYAECNALCNTGCDADEACVLLGSGWKCVTAGTVAPGAECDDSTECTKGVCAKAEGATAATCVPPCKTDADCPEDGKCNVTVTGAEPFKFCGDAPPPCDAFVAGSCPDGQACYLSGSGMSCQKEGTHELSEDCNGNSNDCKPGLTCLNYGIVKGCARLCSTAAGADPSFACASVCGAGKFEQKDKDTKTGICTEDVTFPTCDPLAPDCPAGAGCYPSDSKWVCLSAGKKEKFENCTTTSDCQPGLTCQAAGKCYTICDASMHDNNPKCSSFDVKCIDIYGGFGYCSEAVDL